MQQLTKQGYGLKRKHAEPITYKDEAKLRDHVFDLNTPIGLLRFIFYTFATGFALRGGEEHKNLLVIDIMRKTDEHDLGYLEYQPGIGKTYKGGLKDRSSAKGA